MPSNLPTRAIYLANAKPFDIQPVEIGAVSTVNGEPADSNGNVLLTASEIPTNADGSVQQYIDTAKLTTYTKTETDGLLNGKQDTLGVNSIETDMIQDNAITGAKVQDATLGLNKLVLSPAGRMPGNFTNGSAPLSLGTPDDVRDFLSITNVNNTSDVNKPISSATQTALNGKLDTTGNAASASKLLTPRTISIDGDVTGSLSFDGSSNVSVSTVVQDDSHNHTLSTLTGVQASLVSGTNIKTIDSSTVLGSGDIKTAQPFALKISKTFGTSVTITDGNTYDLLSTVSLSTDVIAAIVKASSAYSLSSGTLKTPAPLRSTYIPYSMEIRLQGTISGALPTTREFSIQLQRASDSSIVSNKSIIKVTGNSLNNRSASYTTYTNTTSDPFITDGIKFILNNNSGATITLTGFDFLIEGID